MNMIDSNLHIIHSKLHIVHTFFYFTFFLHPFRDKL